MSAGILVLTHEQRDQIVTALDAIERQLQVAVDKSRWQALYVIGTNLSLIRSNLTSMPAASSN
jgi:hypothetical protein